MCTRATLRDVSRETAELPESGKPYALQSKREEIVAGRAKEKQIAGLKRGDSVPAKLPKREAVSTRAECAKAAHLANYLRLECPCFRLFDTLNF